MTEALEPQGVCVVYVCIHTYMYINMYIIYAVTSLSLSFYIQLTAYSFRWLKLRTSFAP
jgi:hypothetical protein